MSKITKKIRFVILMALLAAFAVFGAACGETQTKSENSIDASSFTVADIYYGETPSPSGATAAHGTVEYVYSADENGEYTAMTQFDVGTYYVKAVVKESDTYEGAESEPVSFRVKKLANSVSAVSIEDIVYGETPSPSGATAAHGTVKFVYSSSADGEYAEMTDFAVGTYYVKAVVEESETYEGAESEAVSFRVRKLANSVSAVSIEDIVYGETPAPSATATHGTVEYVYSADENGEYTAMTQFDVGTYYVKAVVKESDTYEGAESEAISFRVKKLANSVSAVSIEDIVYGETPSPSGATAAHGTVKFVYSSSADGEYAEMTQFTAGTYYVKAVVEEGATYEGAESEPVSFRVKNANAIDDSAFTVADIFYGQNPSPTGATAQYGTIEYLYSTEENGEYTEMTEFSVGTYYVKAVVEEGDLYGGAESKVVTFQVKKLENAIRGQISIEDIVYGDMPAPSGASATHGDVKYVYAESENGEYAAMTQFDVGTYYVKAVVEEGATYEGAESEAVSFQVNPFVADPLGFVAGNGTTVTTELKDEENVVKAVLGADSHIYFKDVIAENGEKGKFFLTESGYTHVTFEIYVESASAFLFNTSTQNIWTNGAGYDWSANAAGNETQGDFLRSYQDEVRKPLNRGAWYTVCMRVENYSSAVSIQANGGEATIYLKNLAFTDGFPAEREKEQPDALGFKAVDASGGALAEKVTEGDFAGTVKFTASAGGSEWDNANRITFDGVYDGSAYQGIFFDENWNTIVFEVYFAGGYVIAPSCGGVSSWWSTHGHDPSDLNLWNYLTVTNESGESVKKLTSGCWYTFSIKKGTAAEYCIGFAANSVAYFRNLHFSDAQ